MFRTLDWFLFILIQFLLQMIGSVSELVYWNGAVGVNK